MGKIHRGNYEEFFLLYVDNELSEAEKNKVEAFVALHPDLKIELDMLMDTKLQTESILFDQKELLLKNDENVEEWQLLAIDNELTEAQQLALERSLAADANAAVLYEWLKKTKLPQEEIIFPKKQKLYKRTSAVVMLRWLMPSAAAVLIGVFFFNPFSTTEKSITPVTIIAKNKHTPVIKEQPVYITEKSKVQEVKKAQRANEKPSLISDVSTPEKEVAISDMQAEKQIAILPKSSETMAEPIVTIAILDKPTIEPLPVKPEYVSEVQYIIEEEQDQPKKGLRGIIRKASRIYTKITQPDEDRPLIHFTRLN